MGESLSHINRDLKHRREELEQRARRRPHFPVAKRAGSARRKETTFSLNLGTRILGLTEAGVVDLLQRKMRNRVESEALREPCVIHVKDGKPLTAHVAALLGVPWPDDANS